MAIANANGQSAIYVWNTFNSRFDLLVNSDPAYDLVAVGVDGQVEPLLAMANYGGGFTVEMSSIYHMASVTEDSDYVPWYVHLHFLFSLYCHLRARRALSIFKDVPWRTRMALSLYKVYGNSALLVLNRTSLNSINTLLVLNRKSLNSVNALLVLRRWYILHCKFLIISSEFI